jgi:hypothetical protein
MSEKLFVFWALNEIQILKIMVIWDDHEVNGIIYNAKQADSSDSLSHLYMRGKAFDPRLEILMILPTDSFK